MDVMLTPLEVRGWRLSTAGYYQSMDSISIDVAGHVHGNELLMF